VSSTVKNLTKFRGEEDTYKQFVDVTEEMAVREDARVDSGAVHHLMNAEVALKKLDE